MHLRMEVFCCPAPDSLTTQAIYTGLKARAADAGVADFSVVGGGIEGLVIARGLVNYDASELPDLLGRSTRDLARELGAAYEREVVHRDDLVLL